MRFPIALLLTGSLLAACSPTGITPLDPGTRMATAADADALGGLPDSYAAHPSVQLSAPRAFVLTAESVPFVQALSRAIDPMRQRLATALASDPALQQGLAAWERTDRDGLLTVLKRAASIAGTVMGCQVPTIVSKAGQGDSAGTMAYYMAGEGDSGEITLYPDTFARGGKYLALATIIHEMRHAAQDQMIGGAARGEGTTDADFRTLTTGYSDSWRTIEALGSETQLAYGDYVHLTFEFDAFQTGNQVATLVSRGTFNSVGNGFVDVRYQPDGAPMLNLLGLITQATGRPLIAAVNAAEFKAERTSGSTVIRPAPGGNRPPRRRWR